MHLRKTKVAACLQQFIQLFCRFCSKKKTPGQGHWNSPKSSLHVCAFVSRCDSPWSRSRSVLISIWSKATGTSMWWRSDAQTSNLPISQSPIASRIERLGKVTPGSLAENAGICVGDKLWSAGGRWWRVVDTGTMFDLWPVLTVESEANSIK